LPRAFVQPRRGSGINREIKGFGASRMCNVVLYIALKNFTFLHIFKELFLTYTNF